jgi:small-conductance mechanosensitive channel
MDARQESMQQVKTAEEEHRGERKSMSEVELKALEETARRRMRADNTFWDVVFSFAHSEDARRLSDLLLSYYTELVELEGKQEHLAAQLARVQRAEKLGQEESAILEKVQPLLQTYVAQVELSKEEELVRTRARLQPRDAEELLKAFTAKTGKQIPTPVPCTDAEKPAVVKEAVGRIADLEAQTAAGSKWTVVLEERLSPTGIKAEIGEYQDRMGNLNAAILRGQRRIAALTGVAPKSEDSSGAQQAVEEKAIREGPPGGILTATRREQFAASRSSGLRILVTVGGVLLAGFVLARLVDFALARLQRRTESETAQSLFAVSFLRVILRVLIWVVCLVVALSTLGFSVRAILAGMGIGGLAIGLAAKATLEDIIGGLMIFMERSFKIGDTLQIGSASPAKVVGMTWRTTRLEDDFGYIINVPNSKVAASTIQNFTREGKAIDYLTVNVPARHEVAKVTRLIEEAIAECSSIAREQQKGVRLVGLESISESGGGVMKYLPWWHVQDYNTRHTIRHEVSERIWKQFVKGGIVEARVESA